MNLYDDVDPMSRYMRRRGPTRFDECFRCYPIAMLPGPDRPETNHGGKVFLPPSALDKLTRLHIMYPMLFELKNMHDKTKLTHAGVLEFVAEEGKIYMPYWLMETLSLEVGDLVQVQSTELPLGSLVKLQPQDPAFLDISDPKAVLQRSLNNFPCLTVGDVFTFSYNDEVYKIGVLETQPESDKHSICIIDVDLKVDFAPPVGYDENLRSTTSGTSTPRSALAAPGAAGAPTAVGPMARAVGYAAIAPAPAGAAPTPAPSSNFAGTGNRVAPRKGKAAAPKAEDAARAASKPAPAPRRTNGPHPLRLEPGQLFFGYEIKPVRKNEGEAEHEKESVHFQGQGQSLRKKGPGK